VVWRIYFNYPIFNPALYKRLCKIVQVTYKSPFLHVSTNIIPPQGIFQNIVSYWQYTWNCISFGQSKLVYYILIITTKSTILFLMPNRPQIRNIPQNQTGVTHSQKLLEKIHIRITHNVTIIALKINYRNTDLLISDISYMNTYMKLNT
jgi:hypothetical protein